MLPRLALSVNDIPGLLDYVQIYSEDQSSTPAAVVSSDPVHALSVRKERSTLGARQLEHDDP